MFPADGGALALAYGMVVFALGGVLKGAAGFGLPLVTIPLLALLVPIPTAIAWSLIPTVAANLLQMGESRASFGVLRTIWPLLIAVVLSMAATVQAISKIDSSLLQLLIGVLIEITVLLQFLGRIPPVRPRFRLPLLLIGGGIGGILGGMTSIYSFPPLQVLIALGLSARDFVFATSVLFLLGSLTLSAGLSVIGVMGQQEVVASSLGVLPMALGLMAGRHLRNRMSPATFRNLVLGALAAIGFSMIVEGIA